MGLSRLAFIGFLSFTLSASCDFPSSVSQRILFSCQKSVPQALEAYLEASATYQQHDFSVLRVIAESYLQQSFLSEDTHIRKSAIIGAGLSGSSEALELLSEAIETQDLYEQLLILNAATSQLSKTSDKLLFKGLTASHPVIRLEAAYRLACMKNSKVSDYLYSFIYKLPEEIQNLAATIFLQLETEEADAYIHRLLSSPNNLTRNYVAYLIGEYKQKRFLPTLRSLLTSASPLDQEGALYALGKLEDSGSYPRIKALSSRSNPEVVLAAAQTLLFLEKEEEALPILTNLCQQKLLRALYTARFLSQEKGEELLLPIFYNATQEEIRLNTALALVHQGCTDPQVLHYLTEILESKVLHRIFLPTHSTGKAIQFWKECTTFPLMSQEDKMRTLAMYRVAEDTILSALLKLPNDAYLPYLERILASQKTILAAKAIAFLSVTAHPQALSLVSKAALTPGDPIIRAYANLALYTMTKDPEKKAVLYRYAEQLIEDTILFTDAENPLPSPSSSYLRYQVSPETRTQLMLAILETLVSSKTDEDIRVFLSLMKKTHYKNIPILSGLLMRIVE
ncbi:HEAT repeat domain-containing protein [Chlamydia trachomatis]|uniref:Putative lipoprotein n=1 Tax=Chlamydia trachomatis serovar L2b (strain UCH-1/proctitis) TaxID=471473 RepID=A0A6H2W1Y5_CHLTB|nr:HEAT repeat domain-containing protein [Chlamydia trachomatis]AKC30557.1 PBS lyase [Chlamydia trachomatis]AKC31467.1 PBS lyase [Chlamydia trachomatis]UYF97803.1 HEAT repeat domain-containing protein [Chlamydia trachomatis]CAP06999.1 putative lipoprotein [Chlamydia trachomatis L2b/UCH-1/proctitis]CCP51638.1 hypothetical protein L2B8200_00361 [Chlamydia trachomatis L2b/8200/07]